MTVRPRLAITVGDPRGIGPEITAAALQDSRVAAAADYVIVGPRGIASCMVELKRRSTGEREELSIESALAKLCT